MELPAKIENEKKQNFPSPFVIFLGGVFLLFPIAHVSFLGLPLYLSEIALFFAALLLVRERTIPGIRQTLSDLLRSERILLCSIALFLSGISLSFFLNPSEWNALGRLKSFYLAPILLMMVLLIGLRSAYEWRWIMQHWLWGILAASLASLVAASEGIFLYDGRLAGLYQSANYLALLVAPGVFLSAFFFIMSRSKSERVLGAFGLLLSLAVLALTRSYAALLALPLSTLAVSGVIFLKRKSVYHFFLLFLFIMAIVSAFFIFERGSDKWNSLSSFDERSSLASRLMIWRAGLDIAGDNLLFGIGTARFQGVYLEYQDRYAPYLEWAVPTPHNLSLHFLLEGGIAALVGWFGVVIIALSRFWNWRIAGTDDKDVSRILLAGSLLAFYLFYGLVDTPYMKNDLVLAVWGSIGLFFSSFRVRG